MSSKFNTQKITKIGIVAAIYAVSTVLLGEFGFGFIQFRIAEVLNFLAFIDPFYVIGLTIGCAIANLFGFGMLDAIVGGIATLVITFAMYKTKNMLLASFLPMLNGPIIGTMLLLVYNESLFLMASTIAASQFVIMTIIGYPIFKKLFKNQKLLEILRIDKDNIKEI